MTDNNNNTSTPPPNHQSNNPPGSGVSLGVGDWSPEMGLRLTELLNSPQLAEVVRSPEG